MAKIRRPGPRQRISSYKQLFGIDRRTKSDAGFAAVQQHGKIALYFFWSRCPEQRYASQPEHLCPIRSRKRIPSRVFSHVSFSASGIDGPSIRAAKRIMTNLCDEWNRATYAAQFIS